MTSEIRREAVSIPNRAGEMMYGVLTAPAAPAQDPARLVIFNQAGLQNKGGVGDYFRWLGDRLSARGYHVLRFDQAGTGDSQGEIAQDIPLEEYFVQVQRGVSTDDTRDVVAWARRRFRRARIVLWGQCGGGIPNMMAAAGQVQDVQGLALLAFPVLYSQPLSTIRVGDAKMASKGYLYKLKDPRAYLRLLRGKSDYTLIWAVLKAGVRRLRKGLARRPRGSGTDPDHPLFNREFWGAFQELMEREIPLLFIMADLDNETPEFNDEFKAKVLDSDPRLAALCEIAYLRQADHSLQLQAAREQSLEILLHWLKQKLPIS